jgi:hypothetical protein
MKLGPPKRAREDVAKKASNEAKNETWVPVEGKPYLSEVCTLQTQRSRLAL